MGSTVKKHIGIPQELFALLCAKAQRFGVSAPEYIRHLIINDTQQMAEEKIEILENEELISSIGVGLEEAKKGKGKALRSKKDISNYLDSLAHA